MKKWICEVCGYTHKGEEAPERCPECGASKLLFHSEKDSRWNAFYFIVALTVVALMLMLLFSCSSTATVNNSVVKSVDMDKYLGKWYEIARMDHRFERDMSHCTAMYLLNDDGTIKIVNQGLKKGKWKTSIGKAKRTERPGVLRVSFFGPFYSDYRIMMIAPDYSYALIGGSSGDYLWILSRTPQLKKEVRQQLVSEARKRGYQTDKLIWVQQ